MGREVITDEFGMELTKEEKEEADRVAHAALEAITKPKATIKKKGGWPKGKPRKAEEASEEKTEEIAPAQAEEAQIVEIKDPEKFKEAWDKAVKEDPLQIIPDAPMPEAVRQALMEKLEIIDKSIQSYEEEIREKKAVIEKLSQKYKVIADYMLKGK